MEAPMTAADVAYVRANYLTLDEACAGRAQTPDDVRALIAEGRLPQPSYMLPDGTEMVPRDYFVIADAGRQDFARRFLGAGGSAGTLEEEWRGYLSGAYGVCLKEQSPENIVRKDQLVRAIEGLLEDPKPADPAWSDRLRRSVEELDQLERPFAPAYDRARWGPSSRDRCITAPRERFPEVFARAAAGSPSAGSA
jgi:Family of unknown function (DUF6058)